MKTVFIAGATGYLGRFLCAEYSRRGWYVVALVRNPQSAAVLTADSIVTAQATDAGSLKGMMDGADLVVSALGITRQADGLSYQDVDYQANINLLREAERAGVDRFAYVHVLHADAMLHIPLVAAKAKFVEALEASTLKSTVIAPSGYFSDMGEVFAMAQAGRIWLFGSGTTRINPIHGADLASVVANATDAETAWVDAGGPRRIHANRISRFGLQSDWPYATHHAPARYPAQDHSVHPAPYHATTRARSGTILSDGMCDGDGGNRIRHAPS
jgi:uncharacterized protein YbjT (DUF2867 family)